ncbi:MAG: hypothetical protein ACOYWZ_18750 [Bacillota bacterium]
MNFDEPVNVGLRQKDTHRLVTVFPEKVSGNHNEVKEKVFDWYYKQSCSAEHELENLFVDIVSEKELKSFQ